MDTNKVPNRDDQHGGVENVGRTSQLIKHAMRTGRNWGNLSPGQQESLDMVAHKIGRILAGSDPSDEQHWEDLAGYPVASMRDRKKKEKTITEELCEAAGEAFAMMKENVNYDPDDYMASGCPDGFCPMPNTRIGPSEPLFDPIN